MNYTIKDLEAETRAIMEIITEEIELGYYDDEYDEYDEYDEEY